MLRLRVKQIIVCLGRFGLSLRGTAVIKQRPNAEAVDFMPRVVCGQFGRLGWARHGTDAKFFEMLGRVLAYGPGRAMISLAHSLRHALVVGTAIGEIRVAGFASESSGLVCPCADVLSPPFCAERAPLVATAKVVSLQSVAIIVALTSGPPTILLQIGPLPGSPWPSATAATMVGAPPSST